jgi:membrane-bound lytic murein transglycosylase D
MLAIVIVTSCAGCRSFPDGYGSRSESPPTTLASYSNAAPDIEKTMTPSVTGQDVWARLAQGFTLMDTLASNSKVEQQRAWLVKNPAFLSSASGRASRYIHFIAQRLEERKMPAELALLPIVESGYNPMANSNRQAVGLWQFIPSTGLDFNLRQTQWYDGRRDILASSNAAMDYLTRLYNLFDGDWLLALAAYNAGEGRVGRAVKWNKDRGLPTDFWSLRLPKETQDYVPRLLALSLLVKAPHAHGIKLKPVPNVPYFKVIQLNRPVNLTSFAADSGIDEAELVGLNPAFLKREMMDGPNHLLVPTAEARTLTARLSQPHNNDLAVTSVATAQIAESFIAVRHPAAPSQPLPVVAPVPLRALPVSSNPHQQPASGKRIVVYSDGKAPETTLPRAFVPRRWL